MARQPTVYLPHGGGPCFFMEWTMGPPDTWDRLAAWLRSLGDGPAPSALLVVSAHWEAPVPTVTAAPTHPLLYDYSGFPAHTYELTYPAPGSPDLAEHVLRLLRGDAHRAAAELERGWDHGVFVPLLLTHPEATIPVVELSLVAGLDPDQHLRIGRALEPLRDEGVLILGSGMSYHDLRDLHSPAAAAASEAFDTWLVDTVEAPRDEREARLRAWEEAPAARRAHPREEHLLPLHVVAGAAGDDVGRRTFTDVVWSTRISGVTFGSAA